MNSKLLLAFLLLTFSFGAAAQELPEEVPPSETEFFEEGDFQEEDFENFDAEDPAPTPNAAEETAKPTELPEKAETAEAPTEIEKEEAEVEEEVGAALPETEEPLPIIAPLNESPEVTETPKAEQFEFQEEPVPLIKRQVEKGKAEDKYDRNFYKKNKFIRHPFAKKGLIKIDRDKVYYYKTDKTKKNRSSSVRFGTFDPTELTNDDGLPFSDIYGDAGSIIMYYDYEFHLWRSAIGRFGWKLGTGLYTAQGTGQFESVTNAGLTPLEGFTFIVFPNSVSFTYWMEFYDKQRFVPYFEAGADVYTFAERRDDDKNPDLGAKFGAAFAGHGTAGLALRLGDRSTLIEMDREYGINGVYFVAEFRVTVGFSDPFDFTQNSANAGFLVEF